MIVNGVSNNNQITNAINTTENKQADGVKFDTYLQKANSDETVVSLNDLFEEAAQTYGVSVNLLKAIGYAESSFRPDATSHCGAQGIMQLMPKTAEYLGVSDAYDPKENIMGGAKYISQLLNKYDGNVSLALAAYNAGSGNVAKYNGIPPFEETQNYVVKVTKYMNQELDVDRKVVIGNSNISSSNQAYVPVFEEVNEEDVIQLRDQWNDIFSYDDYELLIKLLMKEETNTEENQSMLYDMSQIQVNPSVAALLKSANIR